MGYIEDADRDLVNTIANDAMDLCSWLILRLNSRGEDLDWGLEIEGMREEGHTDEADLLVAMLEANGIKYA
jgi:hypothetical protein